eukprot:m.423744 g.423744  ORF g.423744 m.423744 type:complete len:68 (-) comp16856_c0_seq8:42-245(-)
MGLAQFLPEFRHNLRLELNSSESNSDERALGSFISIRVGFGLARAAAAPPGPSLSADLAAGGDCGGV